MSEQLQLETCEDVDRFFREGRQYFNPIYVEKLLQTTNVYTNVQMEPWVLQHGTSARGFRFNRNFYDPCTPWKLVKSERCEQNSCDHDPEIIMRSGTDSYEYHLLKKEYQTEWICVTDLMYRQFPLEELLNFEKQNALITKDIHTEFTRANFIGGSGYKWVGLVDPDSEQCGEPENAGFYVEEYDDGVSGGYNLCAIRVKVPVADLENVAYLSLDLLEQIYVQLQDEDDAFRTDLTEAAGRPLLQVVIPDTRIAKSMYFQAKRDAGYFDANTDFTPELRSLKLGIHKIIGDFAFMQDITAVKFNADTVFNATLDPFDAEDPTTWPRLIRVPKYIRTAAEIGCKYIPNPDYRFADFAISVVWTPQAICKYFMPSFTGYGGATIETPNFAGDFEWKRPDWPCNQFMDHGFFQAQFRLAMQIKDPTIMHTVLHRMNKRVDLKGSCCPLNEYTAPVPADCYVCEGLGE